MNKLRPLAASKNCQRVWIVCTFSIPDTDKVQLIRPSSLLCTCMGETPARLITFFWSAVRHRPDFVGGFHLLVNGLVAAIVAPLVGAQSVYFCGGGPTEVLGGGFRGNQWFGMLGEPDPVIERSLLRSINEFDLVVVKGLRSEKFFRDHGVTVPFVKIAGGIDGSHYEYADEVKRYDLILVGRLIRVKRIDVFLHTVELLARELPTLNVAVVGDGELGSSMQALARELGVDGHVTFAGHQEDVGPWLKQSKVFMLSSDSEGLPMALIEAMLCGLPCVVSDVGDMVEVVEHGVSGYLVEERTPGRYAECAKRILTDETEWKRMSTAARRSAQRLDLGETTRIWDRTLLSIGDQGVGHSVTNDTDRKG